MQFNTLLNTQDNAMPSYSMEGWLDIGAFSNYFTNFVAKVVSVFDAKQLIPSFLVTSDLQKAIAIVNRLSQYELENFTVTAPEYIKTALLPYLTTLRDVLNELSTIEQRILNPLEFWAANMLTTPEYATKVWINTPVSNSKVEEQTQRLHQYFDETVGDGVDNKPFGIIYGDSKGLQECAAVLEELVALSGKLLDGRLTAKANSVSKLIHQLSTSDNIANDIKAVPQEKIKPIVDLTIQNSKELELLAIALFNVKTAAYAHNESIAKILDVFKEK